jgi:hypothetical protein
LTRDSPGIDLGHRRWLDGGGGGSAIDGVASPEALEVDEGVYEVQRGSARSKARSASTCASWSSAGWRLEIGAALGTTGMRDSVEGKVRPMVSECVKERGREVGQRGGSAMP